MFLASDSGRVGHRSGDPGVRARLELSALARERLRPCCADSRTRHPRRDSQSSRVPVVDRRNVAVKTRAGRHVVDLLAGRQAVGEIGDARIVAEHHHVAARRRRARGGPRAIALGRPGTGARPGAMRLRRHFQFARHDRCGRHGAHRRARQHQVGLQLARAQASRHLRRIALAATLSTRSQSCWSGQRPVGLGVPHERDAVSFAAAPRHVAVAVTRVGVACAPARRRAASGRAGAQAEARAVTRADDLVALDRAAGQAAAVVRADVVDGEKFAVDVEDRDERAVDLDRGVVAGRECRDRCDVESTSCRCAPTSFRSAVARPRTSSSGSTADRTPVRHRRA